MNRIDSTRALETAPPSSSPSRARTPQVQVNEDQFERVKPADKRFGCGTHAPEQWWYQRIFGGALSIVRCGAERLGRWVQRGVRTLWDSIREFFSGKRAAQTKSTRTAEAMRSNNVAAGTPTHDPATDLADNEAAIEALEKQLQDDTHALADQAALSPEQRRELETRQAEGRRRARELLDAQEKRLNAAKARFARLEGR